MVPDHETAMTRGPSPIAAAQPQPRRRIHGGDIHTSPRYLVETATGTASTSSTASQIRHGRRSTRQATLVGALVGLLIVIVLLMEWLLEFQVTAAAQRRTEQTARARQ
ncbi:hypothetical protein [Variovorax paradoxus]|uniref:hypothetical protein n=1 Tax=Variovorax paradoxus TaxID=34073 RepID=UPI00278AAFC3|nr:hypothetical protein [Variovorax paradoxus]MDP9932861.1 hypothetical protein [Variovorax paradoxus]